MWWSFTAVDFRLEFLTGIAGGCVVGVLGSFTAFSCSLSLPVCFLSLAPLKMADTHTHSFA